MAINWNLYNTRLNINGTTKRNRDLNDLQNKITNNLPSSLSCKAVKINGIDSSLNFTETKIGYDIQSLPNEIFSVGDYVVYKTLTYLITKVNGDDEVYTRGSMEQCNYALKFQFPTGTILSYPCIDDSSSSIGLDANNTITTLNGVHHIKLPFDDNTKLIGIDRRFFLDRNGKTTYKITNVNNTTYNYGDKGLIEFTLQQCETEDDDRADLGICNYFEPTTTPVPSPITGFIMTISASGELTAGGSLARTFTPKLVNSEGVEQTFTAAWTFNYNTMPTSDFIITYDGNKCKIKVAEDYEIIDKILVLTCTTSDGLYSARYDAIITA